MIRSVLLCAAATIVFSGAASAETVAITNAHILTGTSDIASGTVVMEGGRITAVGADVRVPAGARVIDAGGKPVTPGLVDPDTTLLIEEVGGVRETNDQSTGNERLSAAFDVQYAVNPESIWRERAITTGTTRAIVTPSSGTNGASRRLIFAGQGAVVQLGASGAPVTRAHAVMVLDLGEQGAANAGGGRPAAVALLKSALEQARAYARNRAGYERGQSRPFELSREDLEALVPMAEGRMPLLVRVHRAADIRMILKIAQEEHLKLILESAEEGWMVAADIAAAHVPVIVDSEADLPSSFEALASRSDNAARLNAAGVVVALEGSRSWSNLRQARFNAGLAVTYGLPYAAAVASVTANPARIFGEDGIGVLAPGKAADVVIWDGDPLEVTSAPAAVFIDGQQQPMTSRDLQLRDRYLHRDPNTPTAYTH